jgi:hypothetical protein
VINDQTFGVAENSGAGTVAGVLAFADPDVGDSAAFTIIAGNTGGAFGVDALGRILVANSSVLDFETLPAITLTVQVQDAGGLTDTAVVTVNLIGVNEAPQLTANSLALAQGEALTLSPANFNAVDVDSPAASLVYTMSNVTGGRFERLAAPGAPVASFTQAEIAAGQVRFVHDGGVAAPGYDLQLSDGSLTIGPFAGNVIFNAAPIAPPASAAAPATQPPVEPPAPAAQAAEPPAEAEQDDAPAPAVDPGNAPGHAPANFNDLTEIAVRLAKVEARSAPPRLIQPAPEANPNSYEAAPAVEVQVALLSFAPAQLNYTPSTPVDWEVAQAFGEGTKEQIRDELQVLIDSVKFGGMALSVGVVWWASRISGLLGSLLASTPAWRHIDPLPVLGRDEEDEDKWLDPNDRDADANELAVSLVLDGGRQRGAAAE